MTIDEYRALPKDERIKIQKELLKLAPKASTDLEFCKKEEE